MNRRGFAYRRQKRRAVIDRKKAIIHCQHDYWNYKFEGTLDKGKIHCSCPMCRRKSYDSAKPQDARRAVSMLDSLADNCFENSKAGLHIRHRVRAWPI